MLKLFTLVFIGGGLGSVARFGLSRLLAPVSTTVFPYSTFGINLIGSLLIGLFLGIPFFMEKQHWLGFLTVGFCGGFTTFSAFSWENFTLLKQGHPELFFLYAFLSVALCLLATWGGYALGKALT